MKRNPLSVLLAFSLVIACCLCHDGSVHGFQVRPKSGTAESEEKQIEKLARRFEQRFVQTLDFGICFREMFVRDTTIKKRGIDEYVRVLVAKDLFERLDDSERERIFVAFFNSAYISMLYLMNVTDELNQDQSRLIAADVWEALKQSRVFGKRAKELEAEDSDRYLIEEPTDVEEFVAVTNRTFRLLRKHLPRFPLRSKTYKSNVSTLYWYGRQVSSYDAEAELASKGISKVYTVSRGIFYIRVVKERNEFRILDFIIFN